MPALRSEIRLDRAGKLDGQRVAVTVLALAGLDADPALADAIFGDVGLLDALEAHADVALEQLLVVVRAAWVGGETVGQGVVGHNLLYAHSDGSIWAALASLTMESMSLAKNFPNCAG